MNDFLNRSNLSFSILFADDTALTLECMHNEKLTCDLNARAKKSGKMILQK